ncbi:MAG: hypothetical protein JWM74_3598, partial [Myxococcaceae bacterium]|nr:hypothetical protein [Myxococcaceae bacterium]
NSGDPGAMVAALVAKSGQAQRAVRDQVRRSEDATQDAAEKSQVAHMHEQADLTRTAAVVSGLTSIASGALSAGSAGAASQSDQLKASGSAMSAKHMAEASAAMNAMHTGVSTAGGLVGGLVEAEGKDIAAKAAEDEHHAARAARNVKSADEGIDDANRLIDKAFAFLKEYTATRNQTVLAATHRA